MLSEKGPVLPSLQSPAKAGRGKKRPVISWAHTEQVEVKGLPAADYGNGHQRHDEHDPGRRRASNQGQLLPQLRLVII